MAGIPTLHIPEHNYATTQHPKTQYPLFTIILSRILNLENRTIEYFRSILKIKATLSQGLVAFYRIIADFHIDKKFGVPVYIPKGI